MQRKGKKKIHIPENKSMKGNCKNMKENTWTCMEQKLQRRVLNTY